MKTAQVLGRGVAGGVALVGGAKEGLPPVAAHVERAQVYFSDIVQELARHQAQTAARFPNASDARANYGSSGDTQAVGGEQVSGNHMLGDHRVNGRISGRSGRNGDRQVENVNQPALVGDVQGGFERVSEVEVSSGVVETVDQVVQSIEEYREILVGRLGEERVEELLGQVGDVFSGIGKQGVTADEAISNLDEILENVGKEVAIGLMLVAGAVLIEEAIRRKKPQVAAVLLSALLAACAAADNGTTVQLNADPTATTGTGTGESLATPGQEPTPTLPPFQGRGGPITDEQRANNQALDANSQTLQTFYENLVRDQVVSETGVTPNCEPLGNEAAMCWLEVTDPNSPDGQGAIITPMTWGPNDQPRIISLPDGATKAWYEFTGEGLEGRFVAFDEFGGEVAYITYSVDSTGVHVGADWEPFSTIPTIESLHLPDPSRTFFIGTEGQVLNPETDRNVQISWGVDFSGLSDVRSVSLDPAYVGNEEWIRLARQLPDLVYRYMTDTDSGIPGHDGQVQLHLSNEYSGEERDITWNKDMGMLFRFVSRPEGDVRMTLPYCDGENGNWCGLDVDERGTLVVSMYHDSESIPMTRDQFTIAVLGAVATILEPSALVGGPDIDDVLENEGVSRQQWDLYANVWQVFLVPHLPSGRDALGAGPENWVYLFRINQ